MPDAAHDPYSALRSRDYRLFALGLCTTSIGLEAAATAVQWEVNQRAPESTKDLLLGLIGLAGALPVILLALLAGHLADVANRTKIIVWTQLGYALVLAAFALASHQIAPLWVFYVLLLIRGTAHVFNGPARGAILPLLVGPETFHNTITWNSGVYQLSALTAPIAAGVVIDLTGVAWPVYLGSGLLCVVFLVAALFLRPRPAELSTEPFSLKALSGGIEHVRRERTVLAAITLDLFAVLIGSATALLPRYADEILHVGATGLGALRAAIYVGALVMALVLAHRPPLKRAGPALLLAVAGYGVATIFFGLSRWFWLSFAMLALAGAMDNISVVVRHVLVTVRTPDELRGRVSAVNSVFIESSNELGSFESGLLGQLLGTVQSVVLGGVATVFIVGGIAWAFPELRRLRELNPLDEPQPSPSSPPAAGSQMRIP